LLLFNVQLQLSNIIFYFIIIILVLDAPNKKERKTSCYQFSLLKLKLFILF